MATPYSNGYVYADIFGGRCLQSYRPHRTLARIKILRLFVRYLTLFEIVWFDNVSSLSVVNTGVNDVTDWNVSFYRTSESWTTHVPAFEIGPTGDVDDDLERWFAKIPIQGTTSDSSFYVSTNSSDATSQGTEIKYIFPNQVWVQSKGTEAGRADYYGLRHTEDWLKISVPAHHSTMASVQYYNLVHGITCLAVYTEDEDQERTKLWTDWFGNYFVYAFPLYLNDSVVAFYVEFSLLDGTYRIPPFEGFQLLLSCHKTFSQAPERLKDGQWNCSVPDWSDYEAHFACNLDKECLGGGDEQYCPFYDGHCGPDRLTIGSRCYQVVKKENTLTWMNANLDCRRRGGYLVSLNTVQEWQNVMAVMKKSPSIDQFFVGLRTSPSTLHSMYKSADQWLDNSMSFYNHRDLPIGEYWTMQLCGLISTDSYIKYARCSLFDGDWKHYLCEFDSTSVPPVSPVESKENMLLVALSNQSLPFPHVTCPSGHMTHNFLACEVTCWGTPISSDSDKWGVPHTTSCLAPLVSLPPSFQCSSDIHRVSYTLVCDYKSDCADSSDESFCHFPPCQRDIQWQCRASKQCVSVHVMCDTQRDCTDGSDEVNCHYIYIYSNGIENAISPPAVINFNLSAFNDDRVIETPLPNASVPCPDTHFRCADDGYCLPVFLLCNSVIDCPGREDEKQCARYNCPGFYRCRQSKVCVHDSHVCDTHFHCPQHDDELFCHLHFPDACICHGLACTCNVTFEVGRFSQLRYLDATDSGLTPTQLTNNTMLVFLSLVNCRINSTEHFRFPNLNTLDLRDNSVTKISIAHFVSMPALRNVFLSANPVRLLLYHDNVSMPSDPFVLEWIDLSNIVLEAINISMFSPFPRLRKLNLSHTGLNNVQQNTLQTMKKLTMLDVRGCPMTIIPNDLFFGLKELRSVFADNYKLCCPSMLPAGFNLPHCQSPDDDISSCDDLLRFEVYRVVLSVMATVTLFGNITTFISRLFILKAGKLSGFLVFVIHLSVSDFFMGLYLALIGIADRWYQDNYLWQDRAWRHSIACNVAGFLSFLSSEVSAMIVCLITLDRFIVLRFPFSSLRFGKWSSSLMCGLVWVVGVVIAVVPFTTSWRFYSQTGICIPLPTTRTTFQGHNYTFGVMIILNFILFVLIASGQAFIFLSIRSSSIGISDSSRKSQDMRIARGLITIVMSDFLCWFPIGFLGLLAAQGIRVDSEVNVAMAIIVLPLNSALNPFLYNLNLLLQRRQAARDDAILKALMAQLGDRNLQ